MTESAGRRIRRGMNFLSMLGSKLRDLQGTATLAHELIQNAEDAVGKIPARDGHAATMVFRLDDKELIVENAGVFSDCGDPDRQTCEWATPCDFHGFTDVGSGRKRLEEKQKGAFGFGFTAVYQITDRPEVISSKRHWILEDHKPEDQRILQCDGCIRCRTSELPGTRFILPWAFDRDSPVRQALKVAPVSPECPRRFLQELLNDLPRTLLFLDHIKTIKVFWSDALQLSVTRQVDDDRPSSVTILQNGSTTRWMILSSNFETEATRLRSTHPAGEKKPLSTVKVAVPDDLSTSGLFFAFLPTQQPTGLPFHINADFFPTNDRKRILLESDHQAVWNRAAIRCAALTLRGSLLDLRSFLGPRAFWQLLERVHQVNATKSHESPSLCRDFFEQLIPVLKSEPVIPTIFDTWVTASQARFFRHKADPDTIGFYQAIGIKLCDSELNAFGNLLTSEKVGVALLDAEHVASAMHTAGLSGSKRLSQMPAWFQNADHWNVVWDQIAPFAKVESKSERVSIRGTLLSDTHLSRSTQQVSSRNPLANCALVKCTDGIFRNCCDAYIADGETRKLFETLNPSLHFAADISRMLEAVEPLCPKFALEDALTACESSAENVLEQEYRPLLEWLNTRSEKLRGNDRLIVRVKALPICPTASGLRPFSTAVLPGGFSDPIGVTDLVEEASMAGLEPLLQILGLSRLSLRDYITERLPVALASNEITSEANFRLLELLAVHQGEFLNEERIREELASLRFIPCENGVMRSAEDGLYFRTELVHDVLEDAVCYVSSTNITTSISNFLTWLGVSSKPDLARVTSYLVNTAASTALPHEQTIGKVQRLFEHLGARVEEVLTCETILQTLRTKPWLPSVKREWCVESKTWVTSKTIQWATPQQTHLRSCQHLVESTAQFVGLPERMQDLYREFLVKLGVVDSPRPIDVVRHLTKASTLGAPIDRQLYQFLDGALQEASITQQELDVLKPIPCLRPSGRAAFVKPSHCFLNKHRFGSYRVELTADTLRSYTHLLKALGVRPDPDWTDAFDVLREISSSELVRSNRSVTGDDANVVMNCWRLLQSSLADDKTNRDDILRHIKSLGTERVVCRPDNVMSTPAEMFMRDRDYLAEAFGERLGACLIPVPSKASEALAHAGVRRLSEVTRTEILPDQLLPQSSLEVWSRLRERAALLTGVLETCKATKRLGIPDFAHQEVSETKTLVVRYIFCGFSRPIASQDRNEFAVINDDNHLYYCREEGSVPWDAIARELAKMYLGSSEVPQLSAQISAVLEPDSLQKAKHKLSRLGFPVVEVADDEPVEATTLSSSGLGEMNRDHPGTPAVPSPAEPILVDDVRKESRSLGGNTGDQRTIAEGPSFETDSPSNNSANEGDVSPRQTPASVGDGAKPPTSRWGQRADQSQNVSDHVSPSNNYEPSTSHNIDDNILFIEELANRKRGSDRRHGKVGDESDKANRRQSEMVWRSQRVNRVSKAEVEHYLRDFYSRGGRLYCQMRHADAPDLHRMPFRKKNGKDYCVCVELLNGKWAQHLTYTLPEYKRLFIALCPNCAALYGEFVRTLDRQQDELFEWFAKNTSATFPIKCSLGGAQADRVLHFDPKHIADIRAVRGIRRAES